MLISWDKPERQLFYVTRQASQGRAEFHRILFADIISKARLKTLLQIIKEKNMAAGARRRPRDLAWRRTPTDSVRAQQSRWRHQAAGAPRRVTNWNVDGG